MPTLGGRVDENLRKNAHISGFDVVKSSGCN